MKSKLHIGDLIKFNTDLDPMNFEVHLHDIDYRAQKGDIGIIIEQNIRSSRYKVILNTGRWAEVTHNDLEHTYIEILAT
jgi:hypothetical protein